ncbi:MULTISPECIES: viroplasmin family protein [unclassified Clostridioides]|uniref:ribonuclease H1 domain-containing protein n=1 Tax=unclassified Clostridioides TaxID=2635829 RepID=UPI001D0C82BE|nr:viroplasmin family protein [Clostridioides sp. ES-S-0001-02]MCC0640293.1 viroplasmin family protein [Clostridioides sp. ES-S-0049-03]MCC0657730.1 viroplasmin family protein [Clostridioides sp. ES-S-0123-01]MCC0671200.1 viroplasmin family protein [Clostridioides sp. ES-S-0145-01]MCC0677038.1 viroplasmin family protein [Clostridioides sp. ES-W-0018-02]MCC0679006.1 viroplasmin family protein [Clostridioides sp. ES-S-0005-03]MCC0694306.1 viroplasmin family protein [Clostridioides sp. ES-S-0048
MAKQKFYAVKKGKKIGIYETWDECKKQVNGFSGAEYKSFTTSQEAKEYVYGATKPTFKEDEEFIEAYVDGSYEHSIKMYGSGVVILKKNEVIKTYSKNGKEQTLVGMRNVAGEIEASKIAMQYCIDNNIQNLILYFDYEGIEKWCTGVWKTNKEGTIAYKNFYDSIKTELNVRFMKVKAHSGNKYNEEADKLAKKAIGI